MEASYRLFQPNEFTSTPYKEVISQYVTPQHKPSDLNVNNKIFPQNFKIHENNSTYEYKPKFIMSGYIVGDPIAFTQTPNLPGQYQTFSPSKQNIKKPIFLKAPNGLSNPINLSTSVFRNQQNTTHEEYLSRENSMGKSRNRILKSLPIEESIVSTVRREDYQKLLNENILLRVQNTRLLEENKRISSQDVSIDAKNRRIVELQREIHSLKQQILRNPTQGINSSFISNISQSERKDSRLSQVQFQEVEQILSQCLSKYRHSILQEQKLLIDRFRLESKNEELDLKKQKLIESRKQHKQTHRRSSHYEKTQHRQSSQTKQNWELPYKHFHSQRHWKK